MTKLCRIKRDPPVLLHQFLVHTMPAFEACHRKIFYQLLIEIN